MKFVKLIVIFSGIVFVCDARNWRNSAETDLTTIVKLIKKDHAAVIDRGNPDFVTFMQARYCESLQKLPCVTDKAGYRAILQWFLSGFQDKHLALEFESKIMPHEIWWPGIIAKFEQGVYRLSYCDPNWPTELPQIGTQLVAVDGLAVDQWMQDNVLPYYGGIVGLEADKIKLAPKIFMYDGNPWVKRPICICIYDGTRQFSLDLSWKLTDYKQYLKLQNSLMPSSSREFSIEELPENGAWVRLPTFWPTDEEAPKLREIIQRAPSLRDKRCIVVDVRGNSGGDSTWGYDFFKALYGSEYIDWVESQSPEEYYEFRVSANNLKNVREVIERDIRQRGSANQWFVTMEKLLSESPIDTYVHVPLTTQAFPKKIKPATHAIVFYLTNYSCFSACLNVSDLALSIPGLIQIGAPTGADTKYENISWEKLPTGFADVSIPRSVGRNRKRKDNMPYSPKAEFRFQGNISDTNALKKWVVSLVREMTK